MLYRTPGGFAISILVECGLAERGFPPSASNPVRLGPQRFSLKSFGLSGLLGFRLWFNSGPPPEG